MKLLAIFLALLLTMGLWNGLVLADDNDPAWDPEAEAKFCCTKPPAAPDLPYSGKNHYVSSLNFGVVIENSDYTIYRSSQMDEDKLEDLYEHLSDNKLPFPKTVIYMNRYGYGGWGGYFRKNAIEEYEESFKYGFDFFHPFRYDYRTYVEGKSPYEPTDDVDQKKYVNDDAIDYFGFKKDGKPDGGVESFIRVMELILDPARQPVLFHCYGGRHRTGMVGLMIRYLQGGDWVNGPKIKMKVNDTYFMMNPAEYEYYLHNREMMRKENIEFVREFSSKEPIFKVWQQKYQNKLNAK